jgi:hypothetical protein
MPPFSVGDRVRVRLPDGGGERLADVADTTDDPERYLVTLDGDEQLRRVHVSRLTLVRSAAQARAAHPTPRRRTDPPIMLYVVAGAAMLALFVIGAMLAGVR